MKTLKEFLQNNGRESTLTLPIVHNSESIRVQRAIEEGSIKTRKCNVFEGENLSYFFLGRPSYKSLGKDKQHWELPSTVILDIGNLQPKRVFPFDTGAFKRGFHPSYTQMFDLEDFELEPTTHSVERYIGTFFGSSDNYFKGKPISKREFLDTHDILPTEACLHAISSLINGESINKKLDERRSAIEYQFDSNIDITQSNLLAVIMPEVYLQDDEFVASISATGAELLTYSMYPINSDYYNFALYERCHSFFSRKGWIDV